MRTRLRRGSVLRTKLCWYVSFKCRLRLSAVALPAACMQQSEIYHRQVCVHRRRMCRQSGGRLQRFTRSSGMKVLTITNARLATMAVQ